MRARSNYSRFVEMLQDRQGRRLLNLSEAGEISVIRNIYTGVCAGLIIVVNMTPVAILFIERALF